MFFYTVLIVASLIVAVAIPLIYYIFTSAGKAISRTTTPPAEDRFSSQLNTKPTCKSFIDIPQAKAQMQSPWLCREEKSSAAGKVYKVSRRVSAEKLTR